MAALATDAAANVADTPRDDGNGDGGGGETPDAAQGGGGGGGSGDGGGGGGDGDGGGGAKEEPKKVKVKKLSKRELRLQAKAAMMGACHILLKHKDSSNAVSGRSGQPIMITKAEAIAELETICESITPETFREVATSRSDCSSATKRGDLGRFEKGKMMPAFESATAALSVGEISGIVETESGVHLILRTN